MKNNLRAILVDKGLSLKDINKATGLSVTTVSRYQRGETDMRINTLIKLAKYLGVSADEILGLKPYTTQKQPTTANSGLRNITN